MRQLQKVSGHPKLRRDPHTKAILNVDPNAVKRHEAYTTKVNREQQMVNDIASLKSQFTELRGLLTEILSKMA